MQEPAAVKAARAAAFTGRGHILSPKQQAPGGRGSGITPEWPSSSEGTRRKREQNRDAAARASRNQAGARDEIGNLRSGAAS